MAKSENLKKLEELTPKLQDIVIQEITNPGRELLEYDVENGTALGFGLYKEKDIAVQRVFMSKGSVFPEHDHEEWEICITYRGKYILYYNGEEREMPVRSIAVFEPYKPHSGKMLEDTWIIAITIPAGGDYPDA